MFQAIDGLATVQSDSAAPNVFAVRRMANTRIDMIPAGPRRRGYAQARIEVRQLLDGRWRVYHKDELLVETMPPVMQTPPEYLGHFEGGTGSPVS
jgi:hypothetical protein